MGSSAGRRDANYLRHKAAYKTGTYPCALNSGPWCTHIGLTVDHVPAMHTVGGAHAWQALYRQGRARYQPACAACQSRQGAQLRNRTTWTY